MTIYLLNQPTHDWSYDLSPYFNYNYHGHYPQYYQRFVPQTTSSMAHFTPLNDLTLINSTTWPKRYRNLAKFRKSADSTNCSRRSEPIQVRSQTGLNQETVLNATTNAAANVSSPPREQNLNREHHIDPIVNRASGDSSIIQYVPRHFEVDCSEFRPENVQVKVIDNRLVVEAQQEHQTDSGYVRIELLRQFELGDRFDLSNIKCLYTTQGRLRIEVPCAPESSNCQISIVTETTAPEPESSDHTDLPSPVVQSEQQTAESPTLEDGANQDQQMEATTETVSSEDHSEQGQEQVVGSNEEQLPAESVEQN